MPVARVQLPDGRIARFEVAEGTSPEEVEAAAAQLVQKPATPFPPQGPPVGRTILERAGRGIVNNLGNAIPASGELLATGAAGLQSLATDTPFGVARQQQRQRFPASLLRAGPSIDMGDVAGAGAAVRGLLDENTTIGQRFEQGRAEDIAGQQRLEQQRPLAAAAGDVLGDAATLGLLRVPGARGRIVNPQATAAARAVTAPLQPGSLRFLDRSLKTLTTGNVPVLRGLGRAAETGFEGAVIAALNDADPVQTAAFGATAQLAGSASLGSLQFAIKKGGVLGGLGGAAMVFAAQHQLLKSATPGGRDRILESTESGFDKAVILGTLGLMAGTSGLARGRGTKLAQDFPRFVEGTTATLRGSMLSVMSGMADELNRGVSTTGPTLDHYITNPDQFSDAQRALIEKGIRKGNLSEVTQKLAAEDDEFARLIDSPPKPPSAQRVLREDLSADNASRLPLHATSAAQALARQLPAKWREKLKSGGPRTFVAEALEDQPAALSRLGAKAKMDVLEVNLNQLIARSTRKNGLVLDAGALENRWRALPEPVRSSYNEAQREAVEAFIDLAQGQPLSVLPHELAHSLMLPKGSLSLRLRGQNE